jgi:CHAT domain-containing protein
VLCFLCALIFPITLAQLSASQPNSIAQLTPTQLINQAKTAYQSQQFKQAAIAWQQTADAFAKNGDALNQAMALSNLSLTQQQLGRWTEAKAAIDQSLSLVQSQAKSPDQQRIFAASLDIQGQMHLASGQPDTALKTWQQSADLYKALKQTDAYSRAQVNQAQALQNLGLYSKACQTLLIALDVDNQNCQLPRQSLATLGSQTTTPIQLVGLRSLGDVLRILGQMEQSQAILLLAVEKETQTLKEKNLSRVISLGNTYVSLGNTARALGNRALQITANPRPITINLTQSNCTQPPVQGRAEQYYQQAIACYQQAATIPAPAVQIQANLNLLSLLIETQQWPLVATLLPQIQSTLDALPANHTTLSAQLKWAQLQMCLQARSGNLLETSMDGIKVADAGSPLPSPPLTEGREPKPALPELSSVSNQSNKPSSTLAVPPSPYQGEGLGVRSAMQSTPTPPLLTQCHSLSAIAPAQQSSLPANLIPNKLQIHQTVTTAYRQAQLLSDHRSEADALGYLGALAFQSGSLPDAQRLTEQALQQVSTYDAPDIAYRWLWQLGRIHQQQGRSQEAIAAYRSAFNILKSLRGDLVAMNPDVQFTFRDEVEPIYRELVSLLLADAKPDEKALQEARDVIESLQLAELNNFFQQACLEARPQPIDQIDPKAAVLYSITLSDRLAVLTSIPGQSLQYNTVPLAAAPSPSPSQKNALDQTVEDLEATLNPFITSPDPLQPSQQLYNWLIRPVEPELVRNDIKTLVFVMDGALRRVPLAALHDGQQYLVEKYNVALTPGLQLLSPRSTQTKSLKTLVGGLVASRQGFPPLPAVQQEVQEISSILPTQVLLDDKFTRDRLQQNIENTTYPVVHLATHAQFSSRAENTFLLTWDERINVRSLDQFLRQRERRLTKNPIELLILSACQTATGDNRATLGLAGVAVRSGARSTVATLWSVQDQSTADLMAQFYAALDKPGVSKAAALRQAQLSLLRSPQVQYHHPYYWAAFILIGNWL